MGWDAASGGRETRLCELPFEYFLKVYFFFADFFFFFLEGILYHLQSFFHSRHVSKLRKKNNNSAARFRFSEGDTARRINRLRP